MRQYRLTLASGYGRVFTAAGRIAEPWLDEFANMMGLIPAQLNGQPRSIICDLSINGHIDWKEFSIKFLLPSEGWKKHTFEHMNCWFHRSLPDVVYGLRPTEDLFKNFFAMFQGIYPVYKYALIKGGMPIHGALVENNGMGIILSGPGGIGKTTCCSRLPSGWRVFCDDECLILPAEGEYYAHPFPTWSNIVYKRSKQSWDVSSYLPLSSIFFLKRGKVDKVTPLQKAEAVILIINLANTIFFRSWIPLGYDESRPLTEGHFQNACTLADRLPCYVLQVSPQGRFWEKIEKVCEYARCF